MVAYAEEKPQEMGAMKRRTRQIARLIYLYCCVKYMKRNKDGKWVTIDEFWQEYFDEIRE